MCQGLNSRVSEITTISLTDQAFIKQTLAGADHFLAGTGVNLYAMLQRCVIKLQ